MEIIEVIVNNGGLAALAIVLYKLFQDQREDKKESEKALRELIEKQNDRFNAQDLQLQAIVLTQEKIIERLEKIEARESEDN
jgi:hypothetical protein